MRVGDGEAVRGIPCGGRGVSGRNIRFLYRIGDVRTCLFFIEIRPGMGPTARRVHGNRRSQGNPVGIELQLDGCRTNSIGIRTVVPCLGGGNRGLAWRVRVGDVVAIDHGRIVGNGVFRDSIAELVSVHRIVLSETREAIGPRTRSIGRDRLGIDRRAVPEQVDGNGGRARAVAVVVVVPVLHA